MELGVYKYGIDDIDKDPLCICLGKYLEDPLYRNILKIEEHSDYCLCLYDGVWVAVPDNKAVSDFILKHIPAIYEQAIKAYGEITENTKPEVKQNIETLIFTIQNVLEGNELIMLYVYDRVKQLLYHITKRYNKNDRIELHTKVYKERVIGDGNQK